MIVNISIKSRKIFINWHQILTWLNKISKFAKKKYIIIRLIKLQLKKYKVLEIFRKNN
jgi:hypothetical protein